LVVPVALLALAATIFARLPVTHAASAQDLGSAASPAGYDLYANKKMTRPNDCGLVWRVMSTSNGGTHINALRGVEAISANDVWAVGDYTDLIGGAENFRAMAQHWDGSVWSMVTVPQPGVQSDLSSISALSSNDIWAVGDYMPNSTVYSTFVLHWDGSSWTQVPSPNISASYDILSSVAAVSPDAVWAVGSQTSQAGLATLVLFWDGSNWASVPSPSPDLYDNLRGVTATGVDDMWAVGFSRSSDPSQYERTISMHCSRSQCNMLSTPNSGAGDNRLFSISALTSSSIWAVGFSEVMTTPQTNVPLALRWNGQGWSTLPTPPLPAGTDADAFSDVIPVSPNAIWAVGSANNSSTGQTQTLAALWNGASWTASNPLNLGPNNSFFAGDALSVGDVWAVGSYGNNSTDTSQTLAERYNDPCVTPSPTPTNIPNPSPTPPSSCSIQFTDVPMGSTFYSYVHCLACRNILGGYTTSCPTGNPCFKPGNPVTRGQLAKIVSNSAGYNDQHNNQTFQDVPVGSPFYDFVERLSSRSIIGGYACGGLGEPCVPPANLPYFRPNAQVTRGQTSKIVAIAASLPAPPQGEQTFQDVPTNSTFWQWIESLATAGTIGGYPCGGAAEPCVPPQNRPYFRPSNNVTRGQAAKIVSNTFFPNCHSN
jgi:hypothetical protein